MSFEHPFPDFAYLDRDAETNDKRWFSSRGMGVCYVHEDRVAESVASAVRAEREACARIADMGMLVPPDGGCPTQGEIDVAEGIAAAIRARSNSST